MFVYELSGCGFESSCSHKDITKFKTSCCNLKFKGLEAKLCVAFSIILILNLKSKSPFILWNKNINFNKKETQLKMKNSHTVLDRQTLGFSSYENRKLEVKLWSVGVCERKKRAFFVPFILSEGNFFNICVLSQCIVYWIHFPNIHTFTYQVILLHTFFCLFLKSLKVLSVSLRHCKFVKLILF